MFSLFFNLFYLPKIFEPKLLYHFVDLNELIQNTFSCIQSDNPLEFYHELKLTRSTNCTIMGYLFYRTKSLKNTQTGNAIKIIGLGFV
jgi:hypothetical protein